MDIKGKGVLHLHLGGGRIWKLLIAKASHPGTTKQVWQEFAMMGHIEWSGCCFMMTATIMSFILVSTKLTTQIGVAKLSY